MKKEDADPRRCLGRSRGGLTTKVHAVTGKSGRLIHFVLTAGQRSDAPEGERLLEPFEPGQVGAILADTAYDSDAIRRRGEQLGTRVCIKPNSTRKQEPKYDRELYKHRNQIERFFGRVKRCRRIATRYDKKPQNYAGFSWLAALITDLLWMPVLPRPASNSPVDRATASTQPPRRTVPATRRAGQDNF